MFFVLQIEIICFIHLLVTNSSLNFTTNSSVETDTCMDASATQSLEDTVPVCVFTSKSKLCAVKKRRYDIRDLGWAKYYRGWADVQGQGGANDFCRMVGYEHIIQLSCALGGTHGRNDRGFNSTEGIPVGIPGTWYMKDEDGDGKDDYCRCLEHQGKYQVVCTKAGKIGFYGSPEEGGNVRTFVVGEVGLCSTRAPIQKEIGRFASTFVTT